MPFKGFDLALGEFHVFALVRLDRFVSLLHPFATGDAHRDHEAQKGDHDRRRQPVGKRRGSFLDSRVVLVTLIRDIGNAYDFFTFASVEHFHAAR